MCGFIVIVNKKASFSETPYLQRGIDALAHRGPDQNSTYVHENVGIGHTRLSIVDLNGGNQPFHSEDTKHTLVCNGEIYNFHSLRRTLEESGVHFRSQCDSEVILHMYRKHGVSAIPLLEGMFAFGLLDKERRTLVLARDRCGIKPLYVYQDEKYFICASEIKALLATGLTPKELDSQAIFDSFSFGYVMGNRTPFRGISSFSPGNYLQFDLSKGTFEFQPYWILEFPDRRTKPQHPHKYYFDQFYDTFSKAIRSHTMADVPLSSYLSGGMDSTLTTLLLGKSLSEGDRLKTFSITFEDPKYDESTTIAKTNQMFSFDSHSISLTSFSTPLFEAVILNLEQPQFTPLDVPFYLLSKKVREENIKVAYVGEGADELLGGYYYFMLNQIRRVVSQPALRSIKDFLLRLALGYFVPSAEDRSMLEQCYSVDARKVQNCFGTFLPWYPSWKAIEPFKRELFLAPHQDSLGEGSALEAVCAPLKARYKDVDEFNKWLYVEFHTRLPNYILLRSDRNSMAHSVEARVPFLDNNVIDAVSNTPPVLKMYGLKEKYLLRQAFKKVLPQHVMKKRKFGYDAPHGWIWDTPDDRLRELMSPASLQSSGIFNLDTVKSWWDEYSSTSSSSMRRGLLARSLTGVLTTQMLHASLKS